MGCCLSRTAKNPPQTPHLPKPHRPTSRRTNPRQPPPPPLEEETVKEVLTETPFVETPGEQKAAIEKKGLHNSKIEDSNVEVKQQQEEQKQRIEPFETKIQSADIEASEITVATENRSVAAVSLSVSVSESVSIGGGGERRGGEEVMSKSRDRADFSGRQRSTDRSPAKVLKRRPYSGEQTMTGPTREKRVRSPAKRAVRSPEKKTHVAPRAARGRSQSPATTNPRNGMNPGPARIRRDSGERSGRRSRSPVRNLSQYRAAGALTEVNDKVNVGQRLHEEARRTGTVEQDEEACPPADESLDNPLVSLECFIFL